MTTNSDAYFARALEVTLKRDHPELVLESVKGKRIGAGVRVIHIKHSNGLFVQFPFPAKGLHAGDVHAALYQSTCSVLDLVPPANVSG